MAQEMVIRVEGTAHRYGLGEEVAPSCTLFRAGHYNLTKDELDSLIASKGKVTIKGRGM